MKQLITPNWRAHKRTINGLVDGGWSDEQRKRKLIAFIDRYGGTEIEGASSKYNAWVREETPRAKKEKETGKALESIIEEKSHGSKDGAKKAQQAKQQENIMTQVEVEDFYNKRNLGE